MSDKGAQEADDTAMQERASRCLDNMAAHFREFGGIWEKTARNVMEELEHFNAWGTHDNGEQWRDVTLYDLQVAYWRRIREMEEIEYMSVTTAYREERFIGALIKEAVAGADELERLSRLGNESKAEERGPEGKRR